MLKQTATAIAAIAARGEQIKTHSAEYLWICRGIKPPLLPPDKPIAQPRPLGNDDPHFGGHPDDLHLRRVNSAKPATRQRP
jgi:hypothetical protein